MKNKIMLFEEQEVRLEILIYEIRGKQVMLDSDVSVTKCNGNM